MYDLDSIPKMEPYCEATNSGTVEPTPIVTPPVDPDPTVTPVVTPVVTPTPVPGDTSTPTPIPTPTPASTSSGTTTSVDSGMVVPPSTSVPPEKLPQTGKLNWPIPVLAFVGIALILTGWSIKKVGRRE